MRSIIFLFLFLINLSYSQIDNESFDYKLFSSLINDLTNKKINDSIFLYEETIAFDNQEKFFSKENFKEFTYPIIGVNNKKVKKLLCKLNFEELANEKYANEKLIKENLNKTIQLYDSKTNLKRRTRYKIAKPIFSKNNKYLFIYYEESCGFLCGGSTNVKVYKKNRAIWEFYLYMPISTMN